MESQFGAHATWFDDEAPATFSDLPDVAILAAMQIHNCLKQGGDPLASVETSHLSAVRTAEILNFHHIFRMIASHQASHVAREALAEMESVIPSSDTSCRSRP